MTDPQHDTDPDEQPAPDSEPESPAPSDADPAPDDEAEAGSAATDEPAASDTYGYDDALVGDFTTPDVDLSRLTPSSDGDPDDEDPAPAETVDQAPTGQAVVQEEHPTPDPADDPASPQVSVEEPTA